MVTKRDVRRCWPSRMKETGVPAAGWGRWISFNSRKRSAFSCGARQKKKVPIGYSLNMLSSSFRVLLIGQTNSRWKRGICSWPWLIRLSNAANSIGSTLILASAIGLAINDSDLLWEFPLG